MFQVRYSYLAGAAMIVLPFIILSGVIDGIRIPKAMAMVIMAIIVGSVYLCRTIRPSLGVSYLVLGLGAVFSGFGIIQQYSLWFVTAAIVSSYLVKYFTEGDLYKFLKFLSVSGLLCSLHGYAQMCGISPFLTYLSHTDPTIPIGFMGQQTLYGPFVAACFVASLFCRWYWVSAFILFPILATKSSFTYLSLGAGTSIWFWYTHRKIFYRSTLLIPLLMVAFFFYPHSKQLLHDHGRLDEWANIYSVAVKHPIKGTGIGTFQAIYPRFQKKDGTYIRGYQTYKSLKMHGRFVQAHNEYLQIFFEQGIIGLLCVMWMLYDLFKSVRRYKYIPGIVACFAICVVFLINALGNFPFHVVPQGLLGLWCWVIVCGFKDSDWRVSVK